MTEEEIKKMKADLEAANKAKEEAEAAAKKAQEELETAQNTIADKDKVIEQKNQDIIGARKKYSEMSDEDKAKLTEAEKALAERQEAFEKQQADFMQQQKDWQTGQVNYHRAEAIKKIVGDDPDAIAKVELAYGRIKDSENAQTPDEISKLVGEAYNMLGEDRPSAINSAANAGGGNAPGAREEGYADTDAGKELSQLMGLENDQQQPAGDPNNPGNPPAPAANPAVDALNNAI